MRPLSGGTSERLYPAISCPWRLHLNFTCQVESNGWFLADKLIVGISGPSHHRLVAIVLNYPCRLRVIQANNPRPVNRSA